MKLTLCPLEKNDFDEIVATFKEIGWDKPKDIYEAYFKEQADGTRTVILAKDDSKFCGYVTIKWKSDYDSFAQQNIIGDRGIILNKTKFRNEGDKIYAFKPQPHRFLCFFFEGSKIIVTNGFHKKSDKLPPTEKERALKIKQDYETRVKRGDYYE